MSRVGTLARVQPQQTPAELDASHPLDRVRLELVEAFANAPDPVPEPEPVYAQEGEAYYMAIAELRCRSELMQPYQRQDFDEAVVKHLRRLKNTGMRDNALGRWRGEVNRKARWGTRSGYALLERMRGGWGS